MRRLIFGSLSFFMLASMSATAVRAEMPAEQPSDSPVQDTPSSNSSTEPFNLVGLAYQGGFEEQGIPSADNLLVGFRTGEISALDVVKAAIKANKVSPEVLNDRGYITAVESQLESLSNRARP